MATQEGRRRALTASLTLIAALGVFVTLAAAVVPDLALIFVGGDDYDEIAKNLWIFAILGTLLAMLQLLVYSVLARQGQRSVYLVWAALVAIVAIGLTTSTLRGLLTTVIATDAVLLVALLCISLVVVRHPVAEPEPAPAP
jgi:O-antigen/teichoic acid export membrane protein